MNNIILQKNANISDKFKIILNNENRLYTTMLPDEIVNILNKYVENISPNIQSKWNSSYANSILGTRQDMNAGIYYTKEFNKDNELYKDEKYIVTLVYNLLLEAGFSVSMEAGLIHIDIFHVDSEVPVCTHYSVACDNDIDNTNEYATCVFYVRKDHYVNGDLDIYTEPPAAILPSIFGLGEKFVIPTINNLVILRDGELYYQIQPHTGHGVEHIISVHLVKK
jgi:hypothetical protein